jgi:HEAT repeat protein
MNMDTKRLLAELTDPDEETRAAILDEIALEMDDETAQALLDIAASDADEEARAHAMVALGPVIEECGYEYMEGAIDFGPETGPPVSRETFGSIVARIRGLYSDEKQPTLIRRRAFEVLIRDPQPWQREAIQKHFASADDDWRLTALFAMGHIAGFEREIATAVETAEEPLLFEAVRAAGKMEVSAAAPRIRALATSGDADLDTRIAAIYALPHVDPDSYELLESLERSRNRDIAEAAADAVQELLMFTDTGEDDEDEDDEEP